MNKQKHKGIQASRLLATLNNESTNRLQTEDKVRSHHLIHSLLDQILCIFNLFLIPSYTYSSFSQCNTLWRMLGYQLQKKFKVFIGLDHSIYGRWKYWHANKISNISTWIRAPDLVCRPLIVSPPFPIIRPTYSKQVIVEHIKWHTITTSSKLRNDRVIRNCHLKLLGSWLPTFKACSY